MKEIRAALSARAVSKYVRFERAKTSLKSEGLAGNA